MTTLFADTVRCAACGDSTEVVLAGNSSAFGSPDLDTRMAGRARETLVHGVQRCPGCGYCARDLAVLLPGAQTGVIEEDYREQLDDPVLPDKSCEFLCLARLQAGAGKPDDAFWSTLSAAWVADDEDDDEAAMHCRLLAVSALRMARAAGRGPRDKPGVIEAIEVDLLRRAGEFDEAQRCARRALARPCEAVIERVLRLGLDLAEQQDRAAHSVAEALNDPE
jgi:hypothetical protein